MCSYICNVQSGFTFKTKRCICNASLRAKTNPILCHRLLHCNDLTCCPLDVFLSERLCTAFLHGYSFPVSDGIQQSSWTVSLLSANRYIVIFVIFLRFWASLKRNPLTNWVVNILCGTTVNCCCVQCDCCGFYGGDSKYISGVLCTCSSQSWVMIMHW